VGPGEEACVLDPPLGETLRHRLDQA
jgi:hypothetical protein